MRPINPDGTWGKKQKQVPVLDENGNRIWDEKYNRYKFMAVPTTDWGSPETLEIWRKNWCDLNNAKFAEKGLDAQIDWRSYERQGVELLAQVHEGPAVRQMEKKGIRTEKGEYNRWVKSTNALLKAIREKLSHLLNWIKTAEEKLNEPQAPGLVEILMQYMDLQRIGAQGFSRAGKKKASITTLQDVADAVAYLKENNLNTPEELEARLNALSDTVFGLNDSMKAKDSRIKLLMEAIQQASVYQKELPIFMELGKKKYQFKKAKEKYKAEHDAQLKSFYRARRILKEAGMPSEFSTEMVAAWQKEIQRLQKEYEAEYEKLKPIREEQRHVSHIQYCVNRVINPKEKQTEQQKNNSINR